MMLIRYSKQSKNNKEKAIRNTRMAFFTLSPTKELLKANAELLLLSH